MHLCSIDLAVEQALSRLPAHIHMGLPWAWANPMPSSTRCTRAFASCPSAG